MNEQTPSPCSPEPETDLQALLNATRGISILLDTNGRILSINEAGLTHLALTTNNAYGQDVFSLFPEPLSLTRKQIFKHVLNTGLPTDYEDSREGRLFAFRIVPVHDLLGRICKIAVFAEDITERRRMESRLAESEAKYRFLAENAGDIVWQLDADMQFTYVSPSSERLRGYSAEDLIGRSVFDLYTPEGLEIVRHHMSTRDRLRQAGEEVPSICFEAPQFRKNGSVVWMETTSTRITDEEGNLAGYVGITRDVDERIRARAALEEINSELRQRLEEISALQTKLLDMAIHDALTGAHNRHYLDEMMANEINRARRNNAPLSIVLLDIDHFKHINDCFGHHAGDLVLGKVARILQASSRKSDVVCRWGGEEFLVLLPEMPLEHARERAETWRSQLEEQTFPHISASLRVTASFGCSTLEQADHSADALIQAADAALYQSKAQGRNRVNYRGK